MKKLVLLFIVIFMSCKESEVKNSNEYKVQAQVWTQNSAEYRALCFQAFNTAKINIDSSFLQKKI